MKALRTVTTSMLLLPLAAGAWTAAGPERGTEVKTPLPLAPAER